MLQKYIKNAKIIIAKTKLISHVDALPRLERPFERGESGSKSYLDHEATTSISGGSSL